MLQKLFIFFAFLSISTSCICAEVWNLVFEDSCTKENWQSSWFLDGELSTVKNTKQGMELNAGTSDSDYHGSHTVLWTKQTFNDNIKIEYDFMRNEDNRHDAVCILYLLAEGRDENPFKKDISQWNELRRRPYMYTYFWGMKLAHVSYATRTIDQNDYVRARIYPVIPGKYSFNDLAISPSYDDVNLFKPYEWYHITATKIGDRLTFEVTDKKGEKKSFTWKSERFAELTRGRIGFRQMYKRNAIYKNIKVYQTIKL